MELVTLFCGITVAFTGMVSGVGVLPDSVNAAVGGTVMFSTSLTPTQTPFISIVWKFGDTNIISSSSGGNFTAPEYEGRITLFISTGSLELKNVALSDTGEYRVSILPAGFVQDGDTTLNVYEPVSNVRVTVSSSDLVEFNSSLTLSCSADGTNLTTFLWLNGSTEVTASDRVHLTDGGATLTIDTVWRYDQGPFTCNVSNPVSSSTSVPTELSINYGPDDVSLRTSSSLDHYEEGSDVSLFCSADSRPAAQFKWFLNGELLSFTGAQLQLKNIQMSQSGNYSCQAFNSKTLRYTTSQPVRISVLKACNALEIKPSANPAVVGQSVTLSLSTSTTPSSGSWAVGEALILTWTRLGDQDQVAVFPSHLGRASIDGSKALTLSSLSVNDSGVYTMRSTVDPGLSASVRLTVMEPVSNVTANASASTLIEHKMGAVVAFCSVSSGSSVSLAWFNRSSEVTASDRVQLTNGNSTLTIVNVSRYDQGPFTCSAFNPVSNATSNAVFFTVYYGPDNMNLTLGSHTTGSNVTAVCAAESNPPAQTHWVFNQQLLNTTDSILELYHVTKDQSGSYSCFAFNNETNLSHNVTGYLEIKDATSGSEQPPADLWLLCVLCLAGVVFTFTNI
ncbi:carcinoembryonic antigen-related cell adhesion molecule 5-like [Boleophthalmus pectinirostris]|uniref:carcinoembryonic antigen-related cell adhesion molecule 5-like n=1 Tax=Boleophthalmus pectinirostris TaxID=150288 RepID=UPI00242B24D5|nr:carcinoembryonic antigen-related cell adhesion molecule 5-like [Boleophthalmus pectinirostris]